MAKSSSARTSSRAGIPTASPPAGRTAGRPADTASGRAAGHPPVRRCGSGRPPDRRGPPRTGCSRPLRSPVPHVADHVAVVVDGSDHQRDAARDGDPDRNPQPALRRLGTAYSEQRHELSDRHGGGQNEEHPAAEACLRERQQQRRGQQEEAGEQERTSRRGQNHNYAGTRTSRWFGPRRRRGRRDKG